MIFLASGADGHDPGGFVPEKMFNELVYLRLFCHLSPKCHLLTHFRNIQFCLALAIFLVGAKVDGVTVIVGRHSLKLAGVGKNLPLFQIVVANSLLLTLLPSTFSFPKVKLM
jgi:hypothetical protein